MASIDRLAALEENWDSYHAHPPTEAAIDTARRFTAALAALAEVDPKLHTQIVPAVDGGLLFVWREGGWELDIDVTADGKLQVWAHTTDDTVTFEYPDDDQT